MLEEVIKLYRFAGISPEQFFTEARSHREAVVAADQRMVIRCFRDDFSGFVHDGFHVTPPIQRAISAAAMVRNLSNLMRALGVPIHEDHGFRTFQPMMITVSVFDTRHVALRHCVPDRPLGSRNIILYRIATQPGNPTGQIS